MTVSKELIQNVKDLKVALNEISVYDLDVYTSMELYYKVANKLNEVITELARFEGVVSDEVVEQNKKLVYLLGEGLTTEVVKKINQMVTDGTLDTIINHNVFNGLNNKIDTFKQEVNEQFNTKANLNEVRKKNESITLNDCDSNMLSAIQGGEGTSFELLSIPRDSSVTPEKTTFINLEQSVNLFDVNSIITGYAINWDGSIIQATDAKYASEYIKINSNLNVTVDFGTSADGINRILCYDYKNTFLGNVNNNSNARVQTFRLLENTYFIRISGNTARTPDIMIVEGDTLPSSYVPYSKVSKLKDIKLDEKSVSVNNLDFATHIKSSNLFDIRKVVNGLGRGNIGETYFPDDSSNVNYGNYKHYILPCNSNQKFTVTGTSYYYLFLDENNKVLSRGGNATSNVNNVTITSPVGCVNIVINFRYSAYPVQSYMIVEGDTLPSSYVKYVNAIKFKMDIYNENTNNNIMYISPTGNDNNDGSEINPKLTIQACVNSGCYNIVAKPGIYKGQKLSVSNALEKLSIVCKYSTVSNAETPMAIFDNSNDLSISLDSETSLYSTNLVVTSDSNFYKVFVSKSLPIIRDGLRSESYNCIVWETFGDIISDKKLKPVLTLEECKSSKGTFYYDYTNTKLYLNPTSTVANYKILVNEEGNSFDIQNINELILENVKIIYTANRCLFTDNVNNANIINCDFGYSAYGSNVVSQNTNIKFNRCNSYKACGDGFAPVSAGNHDFIDCKGFYNYDDGLSHHDGCTGTVIGGEYYNNTKGGNAPAHGAIVNMYNVISHDNGYGFYCQADRNVGRKQNLVGCVAYNNNIGLSVSNYHVKTFNCKFENNTTQTSVTDNENTSLTQL